jgi:REP element-mobilizing transposase RayT
MLKLEFGKYYHVYNRGNNREDLFKENRNYEFFLRLYWKHILPVAETFAYCLMPNHFHFLIRIREQEEIQTRNKPDRSSVGYSQERPVRFRELNPTQQFSNLFNSYTKSINKAYNRTGNLFKRPFQRREVTSERYFTELILYIHFNPQKHRLSKDFREYPYSSYRAFLDSTRTDLSRVEVLCWFGGVESYQSIHTDAWKERKDWNLDIDLES